MFPNDEYFRLFQSEVMCFGSFVSDRRVAGWSQDDPQRFSAESAGCWGSRNGVLRLHTERSMGGVILSGFAMSQGVEFRESCGCCDVVPSLRKPG